jgi:hypothetical protein
LSTLVNFRQVLSSFVKCFLGGFLVIQGLAPRAGRIPVVPTAAPAPTEKPDVHNNPKTDFQKSIVAMGGGVATAATPGRSVPQRSAVGAWG